MRTRLDHIHLFASDLAATIEFFTTLLGARVVWDDDAAGARNVRLRIGDAFIQLYDQPPKAPRGGAVHHIGIETDDLDALVARMSERGFHFRNKIRDAGTFRYVMIAGPDDLLIELFECRERERWEIPR